MKSIEKNFEIKNSEKNIDYEAAVKLMQNRVNGILEKNKKSLFGF